MIDTYDPRYPRPVAHHPEGGGGEFDLGDPAGQAAAVFAGLHPDAHGNVRPMAAHRRARLGRPRRPEGGPDAA
jgi:hypothetical protein